MRLKNIFCVAMADLIKKLFPHEKRFLNQCLGLLIITSIGIHIYDFLEISFLKKEVPSCWMSEHLKLNAFCVRLDQEGQTQASN